MSVLLGTAAALPICVGLIGIVMAIDSVRASRSARRRDAAWKADRAALPWNQMPMGFHGVCVALLWVWACACALLAFPWAHHPAGRPYSPALAVVLLSAAAILTAHTAVIAVWRRRTRRWHVRFPQDPLRAGEWIPFELCPADGGRLPAGLTFKLVGWPAKWNRAKDYAVSGSFIRKIAGTVQLEPAQPGPDDRLEGKLLIDPAGLSPAPPEGVRRPKRMLPFLRVRAGFWRTCLFDVPIEAAYMTRESTSGALHGR
jgi:NADH:ubiquinone oxidoreductase subunit 3 (subunit A)